MESHNDTPNLPHYVNFENEWWLSTIHEVLPLLLLLLTTQKNLQEIRG